MIVKYLKKITQAFGFDIVRYSGDVRLPVDMPPEYAKVYKDVRHYTMSSPERVYALCEAVKYIHKNQIPGAIAECGVWKGGSMMAVANLLLAVGDAARELYLFDTFEGMSEPTAHDKSHDGVLADVLLAESDRSNKEEASSVWCHANLDSVKAALLSTGYPQEKVHFIKGKVEETIPGAAPEKIALLRLDTDWYESTLHELEHLFPRLVKGGVLIIDDYGHWEGAKKAVDEYINSNRLRILLGRIDYTGRIAVKLD